MFLRNCLLIAIIQLIFVLLCTVNNGENVGFSNVFVSTLQLRTSATYQLQNEGSGDCCGSLCKRLRKAIRSCFCCCSGDSSNENEDLGQSGRYSPKTDESSHNLGYEGNPDGSEDHSGNSDDLPPPPTDEELKQMGLSECSGKGSDLNNESQC